MNSTDPWQGISRPPSGNQLAAKRADHGGRHDFFWARDGNGRCVLLLQHHEQMPEGLRLPELRGIEVRDELPPNAAGHSTLRISLEMAEGRDIFAELCRDMISAAEGAESQQEALRLVITRMWRWHHLMRSGPNRRLSEEEQKGLLGELTVLERLADSGSVRAACEAWVGPTRAARDFDFGPAAIEVKAPRGASDPFVEIASEDQLDDSGLDALFLVVVPVTRTGSDTDEGVSVCEFADRLRTRLDRDAPDALIHFEAMLMAGGLRPDDDYATTRWDVGKPEAFGVDAGFPRLSSPDLPRGLSNLRYRVEVSSFGHFRREWDHLTRTLGFSNS